jgi:putative ABC transport system ATP-binding protein
LYFDQDKEKMMTALLETKELTKTFGAGRTEVVAVRQVSLQVNAGEVLVIMGPSGSGKTTLLSMMGCLLQPDAGQMIIDGKKVSDLSKSKLAQLRCQNFGFVFQSFNLLTALNARENVEIQLNLNGIKGKQARERAQTLLSELGLEDRLDFHPDKLSGGEMQRVAIARALANDPKIILADEPTANLDSKRGTAVLDIFQRLASEQQHGVVIVTHDPRVKSIASRVLTMEDGCLKENGIESS